LLKEKGVAATVISNPFINRVDLETIGGAVKACSGRIVTIEDHQIICGMGAQIAHALSQTGITHRMRSLGMNGEFGRSACVAEDLYKDRGLTATALVEAAQDLIKQG
jgi:transketolase